MGKVYKDKKGSSCKMCKPHKNGWDKKNKKKHIHLEKSDMEWIEIEISNSSK